MATASAGTKVVYILGPARTGSGVLGRILSTIEGTAFAGELRRLYSRGLRPDRTCSCGRPHAECPVWSRLLVPGAPYLDAGPEELRRVQRAAAPDRHPWIAALRYLWRSSTPLSETAAGRYLATYSDLHEAFARVTGTRVVINSSKTPAEAALLAFAPGLAVTFVQMVRDPRGVAFSFQRHARTSTRLAGHVAAIRAGSQWLARQLTNEMIRRRHGTDRWLVVRYERFVEDPRPTVEAVAKMLGSSPPVADLAPGIPITVPEAHGPDGSKRRRFVGTKVTLRSDDQWRTQLDRLDRVLVTLLTFPLLHRYGYPIRTLRLRIRKA
jgi:hypothetical protein